jgi:hypothetical protein
MVVDWSGNFLRTIVATIFEGAAHTTRHRPPSLDVSWRLLFSDTKTFQIPNANFCYALFGLGEGLGTIGTQEIHWQIHDAHYCDQFGLAGTEPRRGRV